MNATITDITPAIAAAWLAKNTSNRKLRKHLVERYRRDMETGRWGTPDSAYCLADDGTLLNAQHRLHAIIASGRTARAQIVVTGCPREMIRDMDQGKPRTAKDSVTLGHGVLTSDQEVAIARTLAFGLEYCEQTTHHDIADALRRFAPELAAMREFPRGRGMTAVVYGVLGRALRCGHDAARIKAMCAAIATGEIAHPGDTAAIRLRDFLLTARSRGGAAMRTEIRAKAQTALAHFLLRRPMSKLYGCAMELFPIHAHETRTNSAIARDLRALLQSGDGA